jgi:hypothetical protein
VAPQLMTVGRDLASGARRARDVGALAALVLCAAVATSCDEGSPTGPSLSSLTGEWSFAVSAAPACQSVLPFGYGVAPLGGGIARLVQDGRTYSGGLFIFGVPSGTISGTIGSETDPRAVTALTVTLSLDGLNQGVTKPEDAPCRVVATGTGERPETGCDFIFRIDGELACPHSCVASGHFLRLSGTRRGC